ncbi:hypothetical protein UVI_02055020 [Ustilaginoidea virens]|uniref:Uncharacterized protein n=1 Tax=Ustilaginoidea virens TaxID=1159556 RepID=A0A1B5L6M3_USTVR|nr:hypothetical protein UVI_02055020 [Ustilaginoidea virens]
MFMHQAWTGQAGNERQLLRCCDIARFGFAFSPGAERLGPLTGSRLCLPTMYGYLPRHPVPKAPNVYANFNNLSSAAAAGPPVALGRNKAPGSEDLAATKTRARTVAWRYTSGSRNASRSPRCGSSPPSSAEASCPCPSATSAASSRPSPASRPATSASSSNAPAPGPGSSAGPARPPTTPFSRRPASPAGSPRSAPSSTPPPSTPPAQRSSPPTAPPTPARPPTTAPSTASTTSSCMMRPLLPPGTLSASSSAGTARRPT